MRRRRRKPAANARGRCFPLAPARATPDLGRTPPIAGRRLPKAPPTPRGRSLFASRGRRACGQASPSGTISRVGWGGPSQTPAGHAERTSEPPAPAWLRWALRANERQVHAEAHRVRARVRPQGRGLDPQEEGQRARPKPPQQQRGGGGVAAAPLRRLVLGAGGRGRRIQERGGAERRSRGRCSEAGRQRQPRADGVVPRPSRGLLRPACSVCVGPSVRVRSGRLCSVRECFLCLLAGCKKEEAEASSSVRVTRSGSGPTPSGPPMTTP